MDDPCPRDVGVFETHAGLRRFARPRCGRAATCSRATNGRPADIDEQAPKHDRYDDGLELVDQELESRHADADLVDDAESDRAEDLVASSARLEGARAASRRRDAE